MKFSEYQEAGKTLRKKRKKKIQPVEKKMEMLSQSKKETYVGLSKTEKQTHVFSTFAFFKHVCVTTSSDARRV